MSLKRFIITLLFVSVYCAGFCQLTMKKQKDGMLVTDGESKVLFFHINPVSSKGLSDRCNYVHPLWSLNGNVLTEDSPADHPHQRGVYWAWPQVWIGDKQIGDPWNLKDFDQKVVEVEFVRDLEGCILLKNEVNWQSPKWKKEGEEIPYLKEKTIIRVHPLTKKYRRVDFEISLLALEDNLKIGGSDSQGYGGFSIRLNLPKNVSFEGSEGILKPVVSAVKSDGFVNISGSFGKNEKKAGVIMLDNSTNSGYPQSWILREKNSVQNVVWPGKEPVIISTTKPLVLKYSLLIYSGKMSRKNIIGELSGN